MKSMPLREILTACKGLYSGPEELLDQEITGIVTDSREIEPGFLYIPLKGARFDGHDFIENAFAGGAVCCLSERELFQLPAGKACICVSLTSHALKDIASYYRGLFSVRIVAITGSVGKTTTKEFLAGVLGKKYNVLKTFGNQNNEIGLPLTLFRLEEDHEIAVLEMGMNHFGEIEELSRIARPDVAVITNIGVAHIENLKSREGILKAKSEIFAYMKDGAAAFINGDDDLLSGISRPEFDVIFYGIDKSNAYYAEHITDHGMEGTSFDIHLGDRIINACIPSPGLHMVRHATVAAGVGKYFELSDKEIQAGISEYTPVGSRMKPLRMQNGLVLDDVYNASPDSMKAALDILGAAAGRRVCILGDMLELGEDGPVWHRTVGDYAAQKGIDRIYCIGELAKEICKGAKASKGDRDIIVQFFPDQETLWQQFADLIQKGDTVLIKASHGMEFEKTVQKLQEYLEVGKEE